MCGLCGKLYFDPRMRVNPRLLTDMLATIHHRGPDDEGTYNSGQCGLGHRRLSIIDLNTGKQPISNEDGTVWVVFNGEIYNFKELRERLLGRGHQFSTGTDTEVIVHLYEEYGDAFVSYLDGMFAFALWDENRHRLVLARDRLGIKPMYYVKRGDGLMFASEIKALLVDPDCPREIDLGAIDHFLTFRYPSGRETLLRNICKLEPGHYLTAADGRVAVHRYWDLEFANPPRAVSFEEAKEELVELLDRIVGAHMMSDVPVGVLLSGGVDSSGILSFAAGHTDKPVHTFTIGFDGEHAIDERPQARITAQRYGANHHEITIGAEQFCEFLPKYVWHMEELVCEPPAIALYFVTKLARDHGVKVLLSGEGGDEAFAGYNSYLNQLRVERIRQLCGFWPGGAAALAGAAAAFTGSHRLARAAKHLRTPLDQRYFSRTANPNSYFRQRKDQFYTAEFQTALPVSADSGLAALFANVQGATPLARMLYVDTKTWLPDDLLIKADKMTMANSVELRVPLLDHHLLEFAASLPDNYKVKGKRSKHILKEALRPRVPNELLARKKAGFPLPVAGWLRDELRDFTNDLLRSSRSYSRGYFEPTAVEGLLAEHRQGGQRSAEVFSLLVLELWHQQFVDAFAPAHVGA